jgi:hypothetical protein
MAVGEDAQLGWFVVLKYHGLKWTMLPHITKGGDLAG